MRVYLHLFIIGCGVVDQLTVLCEARTVARAIPSVFGFIVFEGATEVRTSGCGGRENAYYRIEGVDGKLWAQNGTRGIEYGSIGIRLALHEVAEKFGSNHGVCHPPFVEARCHEHVGRGF